MTSLIARGQQIKEDTVVKQLDFLIRYPKEAIRHHIQGVVKLQVNYDQNCTITKITVVEGLGYGCDEEAVRSIEHREKLRIKYGLVPEPCPNKQKIVPILFRIEEWKSKW